MKTNRKSGEELEFLTVDSMNDNSQMNSSFNMATSNNGGVDNEIGNWFFKQSKVICCNCYWNLVIYALFLLFSTL